MGYMYHSKTEFVITYWSLSSGTEFTVRSLHCMAGVWSLDTQEGVSHCLLESRFGHGVSGESGSGARSLHYMAGVWITTLD